MKISTSTLTRSPKFAALFVLCVMFAAPSAHAQAIKMLPPTNCPGPVAAGQPHVWGVLGWDSQSPLSCIPNFQFAGQSNTYVGIGSASTYPTTLLDLFGSATYPYPAPGTGTVGTNLGNLHMQPVDNTDFNSTAITFGGNMTASPSTGFYDGVAEAGIYVQYSRNTAYPEGGAGTKMYFGTTNNYATGATIHMTIDNLGYVGIGTTVPQAPLDVAGGMRGSSASVVSGGGCLPEGMLGYDMSNHMPVYCNGMVWTSSFLSGYSHALSANCPGPAANSIAACIATCPAGTNVIGGGCSVGNGEAFVEDSTPVGNTGWNCTSAAFGLPGAGQINAWAICASAP